MSVLAGPQTAPFQPQCSLTDDNCVSDSGGHGMHSHAGQHSGLRTEQPVALVGRWQGSNALCAVARQWHPTIDESHSMQTRLPSSGAASCGLRASRVDGGDGNARRRSSAVAAAAAAAAARRVACKFRRTARWPSYHPPHLSTLALDNTTQHKNTVAIRFQRFGRKKSPFYRLVAIDSRTRRDGRPLEYLGW